MNILQQNQTIGALQFVGANSVGPQLTILLPTVLLTPAKAFGLISDEWGQFELEGEVLANITTGSFGTVTTTAGVASPNVANYYVGKGVVSWEPQGGGGFQDLGNVAKFEFTPEVKLLDHFSARLGTKVKDLSVVLEKSAKVSLTMDEWTLANLQIALMGV
jgi:hypothetical protein